ncbi:MAG: GDSL-type esterase/lipase family protein [Sarcina sp.]
MKKKKLSFILILIFIFLIIILINFIQVNQKNNKVLNSSIKNNLEIVKNKTNISLEEAQKEIDKKNKNSLTVNNTTTDKNIENQNFKQIFASSIFVGDSQIQGLQIYDILNSTSVLAKKGNSLTANVSTNLETLKNLTPSNIFIMYGMNDILIYENNISKFITDYKSLITSIQAILPNSNIFINCIMPVGESVLESRPLYKNIPKYNDALAEMCSSINIQFIDSSHIVASNIDLLESDQMHFKPEFYKYWLNYLKIYIGD